MRGGQYERNLVKGEGSIVEIGRGGKTMKVGSKDVG